MRTTLIALVLAAFGSSVSAQPEALVRAEALKHLRLGQENLRGEQFEKAEAEFQLAIKLDRLLELAHYGLGQVYMATKRFQAAASAYENCRAAFRENTSSAAMGQLANEQRISEQIQQLQDQKALLLSGRGGGGSFQSQASSAIAKIDSMIGELRARQHHGVDGRQLDTPTWISVALGSAYFRSGAMQDAERQYREALKVDPKLGEAHNNLAVVCMLTGRYDEAQTEIAAAEKYGVKVNPQLKEDVKKARSK